MEPEWLPQLVGYPEGSRLQNIPGMLVTYFLLQDLVFGTGNGADIGINPGLRVTVALKYSYSFMHRTQGV